MEEKQRLGVLVDPRDRLSPEQVTIIDSTSRELLEEPGLLCYNKEAADILEKAGAKRENLETCARIKIPSALVDKALESTPSSITLGARNPDNKLILDALEPRVRFVSGSETNITLTVEYENGIPQFVSRDGSIALLREAAHLSENLENLDSFIRCVNIRDEAVTKENKDVNKFGASLNNITKHVMAGLTDINALDEVVKLGELAAGGKDAFAKNPLLSFITCIVKSPFQMVDDTTEKLMAIARRRIPVVISSSPMGGATAPFDEFGMVAQINAELLAGITLHQLVSPGAPILYGSVPVRTRLDNLNDMYGAPEFNHYHHDAAQMARYYKVPCYSTAGVGDADKPGIQATAEKMLTHSYVPWSGAQYVHYAFGLLDRTNIFCPEQAILDNAHIGMLKYNLRSPEISDDLKGDVLAMIREVLATDHKTYVYHLPLPTREEVYMRYPLEGESGDALYEAHVQRKEIMEREKNQMPADTIEDIRKQVEGILPETLE
jgi:trimethylamine---corrinoid protein Co-methyltransferase